MAIEKSTIEPARKANQESDLTEDERTTYRSIVGQLLYVSTWTRPDIAAQVSLAAQMTTRAKVQDLIALNKVVQDAKDRADTYVCFRFGLKDVMACTLLAYGYSAFANADNEKIPVWCNSFRRWRC